MLQSSAPLWKQPVLRKAAGNTLRPGGFKLTDRAAEAVEVLAGWRILDVGSGLGATVGRLVSRYGAKAYGVEPSSSQITNADKTGNFLQARGDNLPFGPETFNMIFCECTLSLFSHPEQSLKEFNRVLLPGGFLAISDLYAQHLDISEFNLCKQGARPLASTRRMVEENGFTISLIEDHSNHLKELAASLLFVGEERQLQSTCLDRRDLGYYLMIGQKKGTSHVG